MEKFLVEQFKISLNLPVAYNIPSTFQCHTKSHKVAYDNENSSEDEEERTKRKVEPYSSAIFKRCRSGNDDEHMQSKRVCTSHSLLPTPTLISNPRKFERPPPLNIPSSKFVSPVSFEDDDISVLTTEDDYDDDDDLDDNGNEFDIELYSAYMKCILRGE